MAVAVLLSGVAIAAGCSDREPTEGGTEPAKAAVTITVAAASDARPAFDPLGEAFEEKEGVVVRFVYGSSRQLRTQVLNGAPYDVFASADERLVDEVIAADRGDRRTRAIYAFGRLALVAAPDRPVPDTLDALDTADIRRIAIANPEHAPYGAAALDALQRAGIAEAVTPKLVFGDNVADALRLVTSGNADAGIVAYSLARASGQPLTLVPNEDHAPLRQALVVTAPRERSGPARAFAQFLVSRTGRAALADAGFSLPEPTT
jgi:molybdate transport system substrate-binding protein